MRDTREVEDGDTGRHELFGSLPPPPPASARASFHFVMSCNHRGAPTPLGNASLILSPFDL